VTQPAPDPLPSLDPPEVWVNEGVTYYFGGASVVPAGMQRGSVQQYTAFYKAAMERRRLQIEASKRNLEAQIAERKQREQEIFAPELERAQEPREGDPSPYTPGARISFFTPRPVLPDPPPESTPARRRSLTMKPRAPSYETTLLENQEEAEIFRLRITRIAPDPGLLEELDLFELLGELGSLGAVKKYLAEHHFDGRPAIFSIHLVIDTEEEGPWRITIPRDQYRIELAKIEQEAQIARLRAERGLPPLAPSALAGGPAPQVLPPAPLPPAPAPQGGVFTPADVDAAITRALAGLLERMPHLASSPPQASPPPAPAPAPAPQAPPAPASPTPAPIQGFSKAEVEIMIAEALAKVAPKPAEEPTPTPSERLKSVTQEAKDAITTLQEAKTEITQALGIDPTAAEAAKDAADEIDPTIEKNGFNIPRALFKSDPKTALVMSNLPVVQAVIGGLKEATKEIIQETTKARKENLEADALELRNQERKLAIIERQKALSGQGEATGEAPVVTSGDWEPPRNRRTGNAS